MRARPLPRHRSRGIVPFVALLVMVALSIAGVALLRSTDAATAVTGNLVLKQAASLAVDRGIERAVHALWRLAARPHAARTPAELLCVRSRRFGRARLRCIGSLLAQPSPAIVIDFGSRSVPLDSWSSVGAALLIAFAAGVWSRRRGASFGRLSTWIAIVAAAAGAAMTASKLEFIGGAEAVGLATVVTLTTSPAVITIGSGFAFLEVHNGSGGPITIGSVTLQNPAQGQEIGQARGLNCVPGLTLVQGGVCLIVVDGAPG